MLSGVKVRTRHICVLGRGNNLESGRTRESESSPKTTDADNVDYSDFIVVLHDGEHGCSVAVWPLELHDLDVKSDDPHDRQSISPARKPRLAALRFLKGTRAVVGSARVAHATRNRALAIPQGH